ncbi:MAG: HU family DNA-binding protein [Gammaproteobacteria bacterium]|nr:HU family DNA-binding protein [Gammaproteobacteria bacterium]MDH5651240.1 HU family DNA-binding protein [Gammaproteobacteria bacterium]
MNRQGLASALASELDVSKSDALKFIQTFEQIVCSTLSEGGDISLPGFGRFYRNRHGARLGRNPSTGEPLTLPARYVPAFSPGKGLKQFLNQDDS